MPSTCCYFRWFGVNCVGIDILVQ